MDEPKIKMYAVVLDCTDPRELAGFYAALLQWEIMFCDGEYAVLGAPGTNQGSYPCVTFQRDPGYRPPVWPEEPGALQQMAHIDFAVDDLDMAVRHAVRCGATLADSQFSDGWKVMLDPAGHPFCLCSMKPVFDSADFALR